MRKLSTKKLVGLFALVILLSAGCLSKKPAALNQQPAKNNAPIITEDQPAPKFVGTFSPSLKAPAPKAKLKEANKTAELNPNSPPEIPSNCGADYDCYKTYYQNLVKNFGVDETYVMIKKQYDSSSYVHSECHALTHIIGQSATDLYPTVSEAFAHGDQFCASGYYHGVMEATIYKMGRENVPLELNTICKDVPGKERYSLDYFNCNHGLGHGLMDYTNNEVFDSLKLCDKLNGQWEKSSCYGGVFMENVIADFRNHFTKYLKPEDPMYPCNAVADSYKEACYLIQSSYALKLDGGDFSKVMIQCASVEQNFQSTCFQSVGRDASGWSVSNVEITKNRCYLGKDYFQQSNCIVGAVKDFVWHFHSEEEGQKLCDALTPDLQDICRRTAKSYFASF